MHVQESSFLDLTYTLELVSLFFGPLLLQWYLLCKKEMMLPGVFTLEPMLLELDYSFGKLLAEFLFCSKSLSLPSGPKQCHD